MKPITFPVDERLACAGDALPVAGHLDESSYELGDHSFSLPEGLDYDLVLTNAGEGILVTGILRGPVVGTCDRCLEDARFDLSAEVDEYYLFEEPQQVADDEDEADYELVSDDHTIDLSCALLAALVMETPFVVLCREDCKGLCPTCGANLNEVDCGHAAVRQAELEQERIASSPFAALAGLDLGDGADDQDGDDGDDAGDRGTCDAPDGPAE